MGDTEMNETCSLCNSPNIVWTNKKGSLCEIHNNMADALACTNKMIYIAGPIANGHTADPRQMYKNVDNGMDIYMKLIQKGYSPICPHFSYFAWIKHPTDVHWKTWLDMDFEYVRTCTYFFYMSPNVYGKSKGALIELKYAKKLKKIIYDDINQVPWLTREQYAIHR